VCRERRGEGAPPLRRAEEEQVGRRDAADTPRSEAAPVVTRKGEEVVRVGEGAGPEQEHLRHCERLRRREHLRHATAYPEPATTTPPPQREHPAAICFFPPSLIAFLCLTGDVEARRRYPYLACMLAVEPQTCRPATGRGSWARHAPSLPSPCDEPFCSSAFEPCVFCCRGRSAPPRRLESRPWLPGGSAGRARRGRACLRHGCGPRTPPRAQGWPLASRAPRETAATRWSLGAIIDPGSPSPCIHMCVEPGFDPRVFLQVESAGRRAAMRRWRRARSRLPGRRAARRARGRGIERLSGRCTPAPCRGQAAESLCARHPPGR
jgi:hypothetical protein